MTGGFVSQVCMPADTRPAREPDALCEGCGARGTVGRVSRHNDSSVYVEEHRYCADCWPQWSAFYRALWEERGRRERLEWRDGLRHAPGDAPPPPAWGMVFASATWHGVTDLVNQLTDKARNYRDPPSPETLAWLAAEIRGSEAERVGPMPLEVREFLAEFGGGSSDAHASS
jgi:hypothetical protein